MTTPADDPRNIRVGTAEREAAIAALGEHWRAGRLDPAEHEARTTKAFNAVTRADLDALFTDLPPRPADAPLTPTAGSAEASGVPAQADSGRRRDIFMALLPFICLGLFFTVARTWLVWLLIPVVAILLYGPDGRKGGRRQGGR